MNYKNGLKIGDTMYENIIDNIFQNSLICSTIILFIIGLREIILKKNTKKLAQHQKLCLTTKLP